MVRLLLKIVGTHIVTDHYTFLNGNTLTLALSREPGRATWITRRDYAFNNSPLYWHRTAYDAEGRPTETEDSLSSTREWLYNLRSELVGASGTQTRPYDYAFSYDSIGNRLTSSDDFGTATYAANSLNQYTVANRTIDQLVLRSFSEGGSNNLTCDADGNLTQDDRFTYAYDDENRLVSVTPLNPYPFNAVVNAYDHRNRRIRKDVWGYHEGDWRYQETHTFVWDGWNIVLEQITNGDQVIHTIEYFWGNDLSGTEEGAGGVGGLLATRIDGVFYIPVYGGNGNIMMYVDETGAIAAQFDYDPYGRVLVAPNYWENLWNFGFSTKYHDWETDLVAYQLRTYDSLHGRWLNRDPIEETGGENLYAFCGNLRFRLDELGLIPAIRPVGPSPYVINDCLWFAVFFEDVTLETRIYEIKHYKQDLYKCGEAGGRLSSVTGNDEFAASWPSMSVLWPSTGVLFGEPYSSLLMHSIPGEAKCRRGKIVFTCDFYLGMDPGPLFSGLKIKNYSSFNYNGNDGRWIHNGRAVDFDNDDLNDLP